ncbi:MAG: hypothetical protein ACREMP_11190 [Candidatus Tyrphobacter sp.]
MNRFSRSAVLLFLYGCAHSVQPPAMLAHETPGPTQATGGAPVYVGNPAASVRIETRILGVSPDGYARWLAIARFFDKNGKPTLILANSNLDWIPSVGQAQWQNRMRYGQPSAIVSVDRNGPIALTVRPTLPRLRSVVVRTDTRRWRGPRVVAAAVGPHLVQVGWFPYSPKLVTIARTDAHGITRVLGTVAGGSTFRDPSVVPGAVYRYTVTRSGSKPVATNVVHVPSPLPHTAIGNAAGSAMWLYFTTDPIDDIYFRKLDPQAIVAQAVAAHLHYVELRAAYGAFFEITPQAKPIVDAIVDGLESHGIGVIGWSVPRQVRYDDLRAAVEIAEYRTSQGRHFTGLAVDAERGDEFMGDGKAAIAALGEYMTLLRQAVGPKYLVVATVEDPYFEHLNAKKYPYPVIARAADVLQPMAYWRMMRKRAPESAAQVGGEMRASYRTLLRMAGRRMPVSMGGQTSALTATGYPPPDEILASMRASKRAGAIGEAFFAWGDTLPQQWKAIGGFDWH